MHFDEYQDQSTHTAIYDASSEGIALAYLSLGLTGESGEVADKAKKVLRGDFELNNETRLEFAKELGDVLWYLAQYARELGFPLSEIARMNLQKTQSRQYRNQIKGNGDDR